MDDRQVLVGNDEGDVVAFAQDVPDERVVVGIDGHVAQHALHGVYPEFHLVLLLLLELPRHLVGEKQRERDQRDPGHDRHDAVAEGEQVSGYVFESRHRCFGTLSSSFAAGLRNGYSSSACTVSFAASCSVSGCATSGESIRASCAGSSSSRTASATSRSSVRPCSTTPST